MNTVSAIKLGAAICASSIIIPAALAQSESTQPARSPADSYSTRANDADRTGEAQSIGASNLEAARKAVDSAAYSDRKRVSETLENSIDAAKQEEDNLKDVADNLSGSQRDQFDATAKVAESRREALKDSCDELEDAKAQEWDTRKRQVLENIEMYGKALQQVRKAAVGAPTSPSVSP